MQSLLQSPPQSLDGLIRLRRRCKLTPNYSTLSSVFKKGRQLVHGNSRKECYFLRVGFISTWILRYFRLSSKSFIQVLIRAYTKHYRGSDQSSIGLEWRNKYKTIFAIVMCAKDIKRNVPAQPVFSNLCRFPLRFGLISQWISWLFAHFNG